MVTLFTCMLHPLPKNSWTLFTIVLFALLQETLSGPTTVTYVGWSPLADRRGKHCLLFVYKALVGKLPNYLMSLLKLKSICHNTRSQSLISLEIPLTKTNIGKIAFKLFASHKWNTIQVELK